MRYEVIAGERRYRAALDAGLKKIPAQVRDLDDGAALSAQLTENIQREDIHPLNEAEGMRCLKDEAGFTVSEIAKRIGKDARYVARRLALTDLIEEAKDDFRQDLITLGHALEICRLSPEIQKEALEACYESKSIWNQQDQTYTYEPDKEKPARHVRELQEWLERHVRLNLHSAPFKMDDTRLRNDCLTCVDCPERTGHNQMLFSDITNIDTCLNPLCFQNKLETFVQLKRDELDKKNGKPTAYISSSYRSERREKGIIGRSDYRLLEKKSDRCDHAEQAVCIDSNEVGQVRWICRDRDCKDHLGRVREYESYSSHQSGGSSESASEARNNRKQELFDIKVAEPVRKRVMTEALATYGWPLDRADLNEIAKEFFRRIPSEHQTTILEVFGWTEKDFGSFRREESAILREIAALDEDHLAKFLRLCSFAHYGANREAQYRVSQEAVVELSRSRHVNYALIDAQVRYELSPKKYKGDHQTYLDAITKGETAQIPVVYETPKEPTLVVEQADETIRDTETEIPKETSTKTKSRKSPVLVASKKKLPVTSKGGDANGKG